MTDAAYRRAGGYSLGMRQRLQLASALLGDPDVLVLDEPANGLDPEGIAWLRGFLRHQADSGRTVLVSSHVLSEVEQTVDDVVIVARGRLVAAGPLADLTADGRPVVVRTPDVHRLETALGTPAHGHGRARGPRRPRRPRGHRSARSARAALAAQVELHELRDGGSDLEHVFLSLVEGDGPDAARRTSRTAAPRPGGRPVMTALVRSELLKIRSTRMWWGLGLGALAFVALNVVSQVFAPATDGVAPLASPQGVRNVWASAGSAGAVFALILGILGHDDGVPAPDHLLDLPRHPAPRPGRHREADRARRRGRRDRAGLLRPDRGPGRPAARRPRRRHPQHLDGRRDPRRRPGRDRLLRDPGRRRGRLIPNQILAVLGALIWLFLIEALLVAFLPEVGRWLPGGAANGLLQSSAFDNDLLDPWAGGLLLLAYALRLRRGGHADHAAPRRHLTSTSVAGRSSAGSATTSGAG